MSATLRTFTVRQPLAQALLHLGFGVIGKYHTWELQHLGLHCSTQTGPPAKSGFRENNDQMRARLIELGLLERHGPDVLFGHVFARAFVMRRIACDASTPPLQSNLGEPWASAWLRFWLPYRPQNLYLLSSVDRVRPFPWVGKMSCCPVPESQFELEEDRGQVQSAHGSPDSQ